MTAPAITRAEELVVQIKQGPYWRLFFVPGSYRPRFGSSKAVRSAVWQSRFESAWGPFPEFADNSERSGNGAIDGGWEGFAADRQMLAWRATASGQFLYYHSAVSTDAYRDGTSTLDVESALGLLSEFVGFSARFTATGDFDPVVRIEVTLCGADGWLLTSSPGLGLHAVAPIRGYFNRDAAIRLVREVAPPSLRAEPWAIVRDIGGDLFQHFGWDAARPTVASLHERAVRKMGIEIGWLT